VSTSISVALCNLCCAVRYSLRCHSSPKCTLSLGVVKEVVDCTYECLRALAKYFGEVVKHIASPTCSHTYFVHSLSHLYFTSLTSLTLCTFRYFGGLHPFKYTHFGGEKVYLPSGILPIESIANFGQSRGIPTHPSPTYRSTHLE
jgi:hypothetical protein